MGPKPTTNYITLIKTVIKVIYVISSVSQIKHINTEYVYESTFSGVFCVFSISVFFILF